MGAQETTTVDLAQVRYLLGKIEPYLRTAHEARIEKLEMPSETIRSGAQLLSEDLPAVFAELEERRAASELARDALRRTGHFGVDEIGHDIAGMIDRFNGEVRAAVRSMGDDWSQLHLRLEAAQSTASLRQGQLQAWRKMVEARDTEIASLREQVRQVRQLCDQYKDKPPPIYRGPNLSEWGRGNNHGMRDMALAVLGTLDGWPEDDDGDQDADPNRCPICRTRPKADGYDACEQCAWSPTAVDEAELRVQADADRLAGLSAEVAVHQARVRDNWRPTAPNGGGRRG